MKYTVHPITENLFWFNGVEKSQRTDTQFVVRGPDTYPPFLGTYMRFPNEIEAQAACDVLNNGGDWPRMDEI